MKETLLRYLKHVIVSASHGPRPELGKEDNYIDLCGYASLATDMEELR